MGTTAQTASRANHPNRGSHEQPSWHAFGSMVGFLLFLLGLAGYYMLLRLCLSFQPALAG